MATSDNYRIDRAGLAFVAHVGAVVMSLQLSNPDCSVACDMSPRDAVELARACCWPDTDPDGYISDMLEGRIAHLTFGPDGRVRTIGDAFGKTVIHIG